MKTWNVNGCELHLIPRCIRIGIKYIPACHDFNAVCLPAVKIREDTVVVVFPDPSFKFLIESEILRVPCCIGAVPLAGAEQEQELLHAPAVRILPEYRIAGHRLDRVFRSLCAEVIHTEQAVLQSRKSAQICTDAINDRFHFHTFLRISAL